MWVGPAGGGEESHEGGCVDSVHVKGIQCFPSVFTTCCYARVVVWL